MSTQFGAKQLHAFVVLMILAVLLAAASVAAAGPPISQGKSYVYNTKPPHSAYPDTDGVQLTDGHEAREAVYWNKSWVGIWSDKPFVITIDLGEVTAITQLRSHHLAGTSSLRWPTQISVQVSADSVRWSEPVTLKIDDPNPAEGTTRWYVLENLQLTGRWVAVTYTPLVTGCHTFISEIEVY